MQATKRKFQALDRVTWNNTLNQFELFDFD